MRCAATTSVTRRPTGWPPRSRGCGRPSWTSCTGHPPPTNRSSATAAMPAESLSADDRAYRAGELVRERIAAGAPADDPITREALELIGHEFQATQWAPAEASV